MNNMKRLALLLSISLLSGCSALKEATGDYVSEAVKQTIEKEVENKLKERSLTKEEIVNLIDTNADGKITTAETLNTVKEVAKDYASIEGQKIIDEKIKLLSTTLASKTDLDQSSKDNLISLLVAAGTLLSGYLTKQVVSAKNDGKRDARISVLEKVLQKDLDGDGTIGDVAKPTA